MHQMGSHGPAYFKRSPPALKRFLPECTNTTLGECEPAQLINAYDNTIVATDHVLAATIAWLQGRSAENAPALLYMSDHGESLGELGIFLHGLPYAFAPEVQKRVPFIAWLGADLAARRGLDGACLRRSLDLPLSHDNLYHSVLGLLDVTTPTYRRELDAFAACRARP
jgi:lipid A ethanolaminephosphotransferase